MNEPQGPYRPTWTNRRLVVRLCLIYLAALWPPVIFLAPAATATQAQWGIVGLGGIVITYYLIGPSWEGVRMFTALMVGKK